FRVSALNSGEWIIRFFLLVMVHLISDCTHLTQCPKLLVRITCAWSIDVDSYTSENIEFLLDQYNEIRTILVPQNTSHLTLVTKIMLGVFGSVPANDRFFKQTFGDIFKGECGFSSINTKSLDCLSRFYQSNKLVIDQVSSNRMTVDFNSGVDTTLPYTKAKVVDMYGFTKAITGT
ncbi:hypothetical protein AB4358_13260, partial [Vibrio sp. 10N.261.49.A11]